jgi:hypothetical protein
VSNKSQSLPRLLASVGLEEITNMALCALTRQWRHALVVLVEPVENHRCWLLNACASDYDAEVTVEGDGCRAIVEQGPVDVEVTNHSKRDICIRARSVRVEETGEHPAPPVIAETSNVTWLEIKQAS